MRCRRLHAGHDHDRGGGDDDGHRDDHGDDADSDDDDIPENRDDGMSWCR